MKIVVTQLKTGAKSDAGWSSLVARRAHNPKVVGSNPAPATTATLAQLVERNLAKVEVTSSNLVCRSKLQFMATAVNENSCHPT